MVLIIACGTGSVTGLVPTIAQQWLAGSTAIFGLIDVFFDLSSRAQQHAYQKQKYFDIAGNLKMIDPDLPLAKSEMTRLAGQEEPIYCVVHILAERWAQLSVFGKEGQVQRPGVFKRALRNYVRFDGN
jgi:hypothetical protein